MTFSDDAKNHHAACVEIWNEQDDDGQYLALTLLGTPLPSKPKEIPTQPGIGRVHFVRSTCGSTDRTFIVAYLVEHCPNTLNQQRHQNFGEHPSESNL